MARLVVGVAGAAVGFAIGGPVGARWGFMAGSMLGGFLEGPQRVQGPRLDDLKAPAASYGSPIPYVIGSPRVSGVVVWASDKREISHTESQGKGGGGVESTTYSYEVDALYLLACNPGASVRRVWSGGELVWSAADDADAETMAASASTERWREMRVYSGAVDQLPDPTYEATVGIADAPAYRGRVSVVFEGLQLGGSGQMPLLTFELGDGSIPSPGEVVSLLDFQNPASITPSMYPPGYPTRVQVLYVDKSSFSTPNTWTLDGHEKATAMLGGGLMFLEERAAADSFSNVVLWTGANGRFAAGGDFTIEFRFDTRGNKWVDSREQFFIVSCMSGAALATAGEWHVSSSLGHVLAFSMWRSGAGGVASVKAAAAQWPHAGGMFECAITRSAGVLRMFIDGTLVDTQTSAPESQALTGAGVLTLGGRQDGMHYIPNDYAPGTFGGFRMTVGSALYISDYAAGQPWTLDATPLRPVALSTPPLDQAVSALCRRTGLLSASDIDVSALASDKVRAMAVSQVTPTRTVLETLMGAYLFDALEDDKVRFVKRGGASVATIPYTDLGASASEESAEPLPLRRVNDIEMPAQIVVRFANVSDDYQDGSESGDRLITQSTRVDVVEIPLGLTPQEAKRLADVRTMDVAASMIAVGPIALTRAYARLQPADVVILTGESGSTYRARLLKRTEADGVLTFEATLDDASVVNSAALTDTSYTASGIVRALSDTTLALLDIPILRDADDEPGYYAAMTGTGRWHGAVLFESTDGTTWTEDDRVRSTGVIGKATTVLGAWSGGAVFDETNSVTVDVGAGELSSATRNALIEGDANAILIGDEILQYRTATLQTPGVYVLTGFLRGRRGTEWAMGTHVVGDRAVLLQMGGTVRVQRQAGDLGRPYKHRAVSIGRSLADADTLEITPAAVGLKPFAPVNLRIEYDDADRYVTWSRRTRLSTRFTGPAGISVPLGEASEAYRVEILDGGGAVLSTQTVATNRALLSGAGAKARIAQISAVVGAGRTAQIDI